ncbi:MAG: transposase [Verrucomicrobia bacterium]|nr:transposase [Verrucomicrobiota bacterium]
MVKRSEDVRECKVLHRRWVLERAFGCLMPHRRLVRAYEATDSSAEGFVYLAMIGIQLCRLAK